MSGQLKIFPSFFRLRGGARVFSRFRGVVYVTSKFSIAVQTSLLLLLLIYIVLKGSRFNVILFKTFWSDYVFYLPGGFCLLFIAMLPWVTIPLFHSFLRGGHYRYVFHNDIWIIRCLTLWLLTLANLVFAVIALPMLIPMLAAHGAGSWVIWCLGGIPSGLAPLLRIGQSILNYRRRSRTEMAKLVASIVHFPHLRPQNTKVTNLDVGALAPRLSCVSDTLRYWNRSAEERAPTSKTTWDYARSDGHATLWSREKWYASWHGVEGLRSRLAELMRVLPERILFVTSTTRALDVALETIRPKVIVTTNHEHESEYRILSLLQSKYGTKIHRLSMLNNSSNNAAAKEVVIANLCNLCVREQASAVLLSHVCYSNGFILPFDEIGHALSQLTPRPMLIIDGAHAVGQMNVDLSTFAFDFYAFSGHKWLFGPPTLGILVLGNTFQSNGTDYLRLKAEAYEALALRGGPTDESTSSISLDPFVGLAASISELAQPDMRLIWENIGVLRNVCISLIATTENIEWIKPPSGSMQSIGILNLQRKNYPLKYNDLVEVRNVLEDRYFVVTKAVKNPESLRICLPFYLQPEEISGAIKAIESAFETIPKT